MLLLAMAFQALLGLAVGVGLTVGVGHAARGLGGGWLGAGAAVEAGLAGLRLWTAWKSARASGASFRAAFALRGGANRYEARCIALPVYAFLLCATVAVIQAVAPGRAAAAFPF